MITQDRYITEALKLDWGVENLVASIRTVDPEWQDGFKDQILAMAFVRMGLASLESKLDSVTGKKVDLLAATPRLKRLLKHRRKIHQI